jgi:hypothetical protein
MILYVVLIVMTVVISFLIYRDEAKQKKKRKWLTSIVLGIVLAFISSMFYMGAYAGFAPSTIKKKDERITYEKAAPLSVVEDRTIMIYSNKDRKLVDARAEGYDINYLETDQNKIKIDIYETKRQTKTNSLFIPSFLMDFINGGYQVNKKIDIYVPKESVKNTILLKVK